MNQVIYLHKLCWRSDQIAYSEKFLQQLKRINVLLGVLFVHVWLHSIIGSDTVVNYFLFPEDLAARSVLYRIADVKQSATRLRIKNDGCSWFRIVIYIL